MISARIDGLDARGELSRGVSDSAPIALGYFSVSIAFGLHCAVVGVPAWLAGLISATNMSSSGQFGGLAVLAAAGSFLQLALTVALVNLRYVLMSIALSQRLEPGVGTWKRLVISLAVTDEIFALAMRRPRVGFGYYAGLMVLPIIGWTGGTLVGVLAGEVLPDSVQAAASVLLYAMFIAIVVPPASKARPVAAVVAIAALVSVGLALVPLTAAMQPGWRIILATLVASAVGAWRWPVTDDDGDGDTTGDAGSAPDPAVAS